MESFKYSPIDSARGEIRLLKLITVYPIDPDTNTRPAASSLPLAASIEAHYLPVSNLSRKERSFRSVKLPIFTALSYVWGDPTRSHEILIDGRRLPITKSLYSALRGVQIDASAITVRVWADAICINQNDLDERSAQVLLMREVYHSASYVRICLSQELTKDRFRCLKFIEILNGEHGLQDWDTLQKQATEMPPEVEEQGKFAKFLDVVAPTIVKAVVTPFAVIDKITDRIQDVIKNPAVVSKENLEVSNNYMSLLEWQPRMKNVSKAEEYSDLSEMAALIDRILIEDCDWFSRMWVVQELGCAMNPFVQVGHASVWWDQLFQTVNYLHFYRGFIMPNYYKILGLASTREAWCSKKRQSLGKLLRECKYKKATDPRDKIFGLVGLMADPLNDRLKPDYNKSFTQVYKDAALHVIRQNLLLDPICGWQTVGRDESLPSWVPDYSLGQNLAPSTLVTSDYNYRIYHACGERFFDTELMEIPLTSGYGLLTKGVLIDVVTQLSSAGKGDESFKQRESSWSSLLLQCKMGTSESLLDLSAILHSYFSEVESKPVLKEKGSFLASAEFRMINMYLHTLMTGRISEPPYFERLSKDHIETILSFPLDGTIKGFGENPQPHRLRASVRQDLDDSTRGRRLAVTKNRHVGALPQNSEVGDIVCALNRCNVPVILRRREDGKYTFVGECYVYGFMHGEAFEPKDETAMKSRVFELV